MSGSRTNLDSARHKHGLTSQHPPQHQPSKARAKGKKSSPSAIDVLTRGATALLAGSACLPGAIALGTSASASGRRILQECSLPQAVGVNAFSYQLAASTLNALPATAAALTAGNAWGMFQVNGCHQRLGGAVPGPVNLTYTFDPPQGNDGRTDIGNVRAVDAPQQALVSQTLSQLAAALNIQFVQITGAESDQANLQVVQADAAPAQVPASTYSRGPGDGSDGQTTAQLVVVGDTLTDTLQGVGGALGLTPFNGGVVQNASLADTSDGWLTTVMGLESTPCFTPGTFGASDLAALQAAYGIAPALANGTTFALDSSLTSGGILGSASNNTLSATFDGPVVLNLGHAPGNVSHVGDLRAALAPTTNVTQGDIRGTQGGYLIGNNLPNTLIAGTGNTIIDPIGGANNTVLTGAGQNIVVLQDAPGVLTVENFKFNQDKLGLQFGVTPLSGIQVVDTSSQNGHVQLAFPNGQNVTLTNITAHAFAGLPTLNQIVLQNFTYTLPQDCASVPATAPAPSAPALAPTPGVPPVVPLPPAPAPAPASTPGLAPSPSPGVVPAPAPAPSQSPPPPPSPSPPPSPPPPFDPHTPPAHHSGSHVAVGLGVGLGAGIPVVGTLVVVAVILAKRRRHHHHHSPAPAPAPRPEGPQLPPNQPRADGPFYDIEMPGR